MTTSETIPTYDGEQFPVGTVIFAFVRFPAGMNRRGRRPKKQLTIAGPLTWNPTHGEFYYYCQDSRMISYYVAPSDITGVQTSLILS